MYHALAAWGLAVPVASSRHPPGVGGRWKTIDDDERPLGRRFSLLVYISVAVLSVGTLLGMERWTISSTVPVMRLAGAPELTSPWAVAGMNPTDLAARIGVSPDSGRRIRDRAQLIALRGIGTAHAGRLIEAGVRSVCGLASQDAEGLWRELRKADPAPRPTEPEVGVWIRAARRACETP
jgi:hypothetical protein